MMRALNIKLARDLRRIWPQIIAIAMVMAAGIAILILSTGVQRSLSQTRDSYYERYRFAHVFAGARRAPNALIDRIEAIEGVSLAESRIVRHVLLDIEGTREPASAKLLSLPDGGSPRLNRLYLLAGRLPDPLRADEVVVNADFAAAHRFRLGDTFYAILNDRRFELRIVGTALSPEFIHALGPGQIVPDHRRFAIGWMSYRVLAAAFNLEGAFNDVSLALQRGANKTHVIARLDQLLERYGGGGAFAREKQISHMFIDGELEQLRFLSRFLPPIFLAVAAFLVNVTLTRIVALQRVQIGLLKAVGYSDIEVGWHYIKLALAICAIGVLLGNLAGWWLGNSLAALYADIFRFPYLLHLNSPDAFIIATAITVAAALVGALHAVRRAARLEPAVAMAPPAPPTYRHGILDHPIAWLRLSQPSMMIARNLIRRPGRALLTSLGIAMSGALLISTLFWLDALNLMIDVSFFRADRQDATLFLVDKQPLSTVQEVQHMPGVLRAEPTRSVPVKLRYQHRTELTTLHGRLADAELSQLIDDQLENVALSDSGLLLSKRLARQLRVGRGDSVWVELLDDTRGTHLVPIAGVVQQFLGTGAYMSLDALNALLGEGDLINAVPVLIDETQISQLYKTIKQNPGVIAMSLRERVLSGFQSTVEKNLYVTVVIYTVLALVLSFGVQYNTARIHLSERARELASLRILGFTRLEVAYILLGELFIVTIIALPVAVLTGYGFAAWMTESFDTEMYRIPLFIHPATNSYAACVVLSATLLSALLVYKQVRKMDLVTVMKTRE